MMLACKSLPKVSKSFTLIEILATIAIMAVLVTVAGFFIVGYVQYSKETADKQTLAVLNDAVNRYKTQGGDVNALTSGTPIGRVISKLQSPVSWAGLSHQFLQSGKTYIGASIYAKGDRHQYHFTRYGAYNSGEGGDASPAESSGFTPSPGVGYMSNEGDAGGYNNVFILTDSGHYTYLPEGETQVTVTPGSWRHLQVANSVTFWASDVDGNPSGHLTAFSCESSGITALNLTGLAYCTEIGCMDNSLTSIALPSSSTLVVLICSFNQLSNLDLSGCPNINRVDYRMNPFVSSPSALNTFYSSLPSLNGLLWENNDDSSQSSGEGDDSIATIKGWIFGEW